MENQKTAHIISHTHWDREWYLNSEYTNEWLLIFFDSLFGMLNKEKEYRFVLDGQTLMIEDFFEQLRLAGKDIGLYKDMIRKFVKEKRLFIGPFYMQSDWHLADGEALIRNLLTGRKICDELGGYMNVGWLMDNFGQISQTPQILKGFGIKGIFVWRGIEMDPENVNSEFIWESPDGTQMPSLYLLASYRNAMRLSEFSDIAQERIKKETERIAPFATTPNLLLMNGYDQELYPDDILPIIRDGRLDCKGVKVVQSSPEEYLNCISIYKDRFMKLKGELYSGRFISVFPGVLSSRMYLKLKNDKCQKELIKYAEPFSVMSWLIGGSYDEDGLEASWKEMMKNHPHDSICGVGIDDVHSDMEKRFDASFRLSNRISIHALKSIVSEIDTSRHKDGEAYVIFNPSAYERSACITIKSKIKGSFIITDGEDKRVSYDRRKDGLIDLFVEGIKPMGYKTVYITPCAYDDRKVDEGITISGNTVRNKYLTVEINDDGTINIHDNVSNAYYSGLGYFEDAGDGGDEYNFSPAHKQRVITSRNNKADISFVETGRLKAVIRVKNILRVPESLDGQRMGRCSDTRDVPIVTWITIEHDSSVVKFKTLIKNTVKDHRMRVMFPSCIASDFSYAETQFDVVSHDVHPKEYDDSSIPDNVKKVIIGAREVKAITTFPQRYFAGVSDGSIGLAVINRGLPEYEVLPENNTIALTLFRSVGWITQQDLILRSGDAGPLIATPDAQCIREMEFEYGVYPHKGSWFEGRVHEVSENFNTDFKVVRIGTHAGRLNDRGSFLSLNDEHCAFKLSCLKRSEDKSGIIVRLYNMSDKPAECDIRLMTGIEKAYYTNLNEEILSEINVEDGKLVHVAGNQREIITLKMVPCRENTVNNIDATSEVVMELEYTEDLSGFESLPIVTLEDVAKEEERADLYHKTLLNCSTEPEKATWKRSWLEARISSILLRRKYMENYMKDTAEYEGYMRESHEELKKIGLELNATRVRKRAYEYIQN